MSQVVEPPADDKPDQNVSLPPSLPRKGAWPTWFTPKLVAIVAGILVLVVAGGILLASTLSRTGHNASQKTVTVKGTFVLKDSDSAGGTIGDSCSGVGGYSDISEGTGVTIRDSTSKIVGTTFLGSGKVTVIGCWFNIAPTKVPSSGFYTIEVSHRGQITVQKREAGEVGVTLG